MIFKEEEPKTEAGQKSFLPLINVNEESNKTPQDSKNNFLRNPEGAIEEEKSEENILT